MGAGISSGNELNTGTIKNNHHNMRQITLKPLNGETASKTSDAINIEGVQKVTLQFIRSNHSAGSSAFSVEVSNDGINWVTFNKLIDNVTNTNAQQLTRVASCSLSSNTSKVYSMDLQHDAYKYARVAVTETTDGTHTAIMQLQYEE